VGQPARGAGPGHDLGGKIEGSGQQVRPRQHLIDDAQALGFLCGDPLTGVHGVTGTLGAGQFAQHEVHPVARDRACPEVTVAEDDVRCAQCQVAEQGKLQPRAGAVDNRDRRNVDVADKPLQDLDAVVVLLVDKVAVPLRYGLAERSLVHACQPRVSGTADDDDLVVPVGTYFGQQQVPGIQQPPGPAGGLTVPVRADSEDAAMALQLEVPREPVAVVAQRRPGDEVPQITVPPGDRLRHAASSREQPSGDLPRIFWHARVRRAQQPDRQVHDALDRLPPGGGGREQYADQDGSEEHVEHVVRVDRGVNVTRRSGAQDLRQR
jgi:hypothetical protein